MQGAGFLGREDVAVGGEFDGGGHVLGEGEFTEVLLGVGESGDGAGDAGGEVANEGASGDDVAVGVEVHVARGCGGGLFAVVEEVGFAVVVADEHESATANVSGRGIDDGQGEAYGYGCVYGVATLFEDGEAGVGGVVVDGDDHGVFGAGGLVGCGERGGGGLGLEGRGEECNDGGRYGDACSKAQGLAPWRLDFVDAGDRIAWMGIEWAGICGSGPGDPWRVRRARPRKNMNGLEWRAVLESEWLQEWAADMGVAVSVWSRCGNESEGWLRREQRAKRDAAFGQLVERQSRLMFRVAYSVLRNAHDAEDAVQEAFLKLYRGDAWLRIEEEKGFVARTVWRVAVDRMPRRDESDVAELELAASGDSPEMSALDGDERGQLRRLMDGLPEELRQVLLLSAVEEMTSREVGVAMGIPEGTVRTRLMRARVELKKRFEAEQGRRR